MILCIDVGNTNIKYGLFEGDELIVSFRGATELKRTSDEYGTRFQIELPVVAPYSGSRK